MNTIQLFGTALVAAAGVATAGITDFEATLNGDQENPSASTPATGTLTGSYDSVANTFSFSWDITDNLVGMPSSPGSHIHQAPAGSNGPVVFGFNNPDGSWELSGSAVWSGLSTAQVDALFAGGLYANFHTTAFPGGEVRGQIGVVPAPSALALGLAGGLAAARRRRS